MKFSSHWWDMFLETTQNLTKTAVLKNTMDKTETENLRKQVLEVISELAKLRTNKYGYRVYIDGALLDHKEMHRIYDLPPTVNESIEQWSSRVFGKNKFGIIINAGEKFSHGLSKNIALKTKPLLDKIGFPREGINFSIFIGNYDKTPLGIHKDPLGEDVMHFHLGPGDKVMYTWSKEEYDRLTTVEKYERKDTELFIPFATEFAFKEGDIYFMPEGEYHIGKQAELSIAVTFWRYNHTKEKLAKKLQSVISSQFLKENQDILLTDTNDVNNVDALEEVLDIFEIPKDLENLNYKDLMRQAYLDLKYSLQSNAGYKTSPFPKADEKIINSEDFIEIEEPYKILYKESLDKSKLHIYVRGIKIELNNFECIKIFIDKINNEKVLKVSDLLKILDPDWDENIGLYILSEIHKNNGIKITEIEEIVNL
jgi:hypothetical protein